MSVRRSEKSRRLVAWSLTNAFKGSRADRNYLRNETTLTGIRSTQCYILGEGIIRGRRRQVISHGAKTIRGTKKSRRDVISTPTRRLYRLGNCVSTVNSTPAHFVLPLFLLLHPSSSLSNRFHSVLSSQPLAEAAANRKKTECTRVVNARGI